MSGINVLTADVNSPKKADNQTKPNKNQKLNANKSPKNISSGTGY